MADSSEADALLSDLCTICHIQPPKYRCPRCSTRTCSLSCSRRHKLWSQCSGVRDPAAYLRRSELATEAAFDRDFNFITGIERRLERADRDAENRGIVLDHDQTRDGADGEGYRAGKKRKRPNNGGLAKVEAAFLKGAESSGVTVARAPRGMSRNKANSSRWNPRSECLSWTVEWILPHGERRTKNCLEKCSIAEGYDWVNPLPKEEKKRPTPGQEQESDKKEGSMVIETPGKHEQNEPHAAQPPESSGDTPSTQQPQVETNNNEPATITDNAAPQPITPHRGIYFYLHRPRTSTKQTVLIPLTPNTSFTTALRNRTVLEFPTIYVLAEPPEKLLAEKDTSKFLLEEEYIRTHQLDEEEMEAGDESSESVPDAGAAPVDLGNVDEKKVLEVLRQDLLET